VSSNALGILDFCSLASPRTMREVYDQSLAQTSFTLVMLAS
jgi:hypothetical protein